jgi:hypothetical protein
MTPREAFLALVLTGSAIIVEAIQYVRGKVKGREAVATVVFVAAVTVALSLVL